MDFAAIRTHSTRAAHAAGFAFAQWLPLGERAQVRPIDEIIDRLAALSRLCAHVLAPLQGVPDSRIAGFVEQHNLQPAFTPEEWAIMQLPRPQAQQAHRGTIGWTFENMAPLAWALGHPIEPGIDGELVEGDALLHEFVPMDSDAFDRSEYTLRSAADIVELEDLFYCVHNAVRCAQLPPKRRLFRKPPTFVPEGFDPLVHGGAIHERRHALTWMLSPGVPWDQTDLST
jgi:hypothetical protein